MDEGVGSGTDGQGAVDEVAAVREVVLRAHPDAVPEMIAGSTIAEVLASVEPAREAFAKVTERMKPAGALPPAVPAGAGSVAVDPATLPTSELIRRGVGARRRTK